MVKAISATKLSYTGPGYTALRTTLLERDKGRLDKKLQPIYDLGCRWTGLALRSGGWKDTQGRPLLNDVLAMSKGWKLLKVVDTSGTEKGAAFLAARLAEVIEEVGPEHITVVIMDGHPHSSCQPRSGACTAAMAQSRPTSPLAPPQPPTPPRRL